MQRESWSPNTFWPNFVAWYLNIFSVQGIFFSHCFSPHHRATSKIDSRPRVQRWKGTCPETCHAILHPCSRLCTRHLKNNVDDYLKQKIGVARKDRQVIGAKLFHSTGVAGAEDSIMFYGRVDHVKSLAAKLENGERFLSYLNQRVFPLQRNSIFEPNRDRQIRHDRTNNNLEYMNHVLKSVMQWKPRPLSELVTKIYGVVRVQQKDLKWSIWSVGATICYTLTSSSTR